MLTINVSQAKISLSQLVRDIERGVAQEIVITRRGKPVARLVPLVNEQLDRRIGAAVGKFEVLDSIDAHNDEIVGLFLERSP